MIIRSLDKNNDWNFGRGGSDFLREDDAIALNVKTRLLEWKDDCFFNLQAGIDWINRLDKNQKESLEEELRTVILQSEGVVELTELSTELENRSFSARYAIKTIFSTTIIGEL